MSNFFDPRPIILDSNGLPVTTGRMYFYEAGTVNTLKSIYSDYACSISAPNPINLGSDGRVPMIYYATGLYKIRVEKQIGFEPFPLDIWIDVWTADYITPSTISGGGGSSGLPVALNLGSLRALDPSTYPIVQVIGNTSGGDGGGGIYRWSSGISTADDGGIYIQLALGGSGRYIRQINPSEAYLSQKIWSGSATGAIDSQYANASAYCSTNLIPLRFPSGSYKFTDSFTFSVTNLKLIIEEKAIFSLVHPGSLTFSCHTIVNSTSVITGSSVTSMVFNVSTMLEQIDNRWFFYGGLGSLSTVPLFIDDSLTITASTTKTHNAHIFFGENSSVTLGNSAVLHMNGGMTQKGSLKRIFTLGTSNVVSTSNAIEIKAEWFGVGTIVGDATNELQVSSLMAVTCGATLSVPSCQLNGTINTGSTALLSMQTTGTINLGSSAYLARVNLLNNPYQQAFSGSHSATVLLSNSDIYPGWFGAKTSIANNYASLILLMRAALLSGNRINGNLDAFGVSTEISFTDTTMLSAKDISLVYSGSGTALTLSGITPRFDNVNITCTGTGGCFSITSANDGYVRNGVYNGSLSIISGSNSPVLGAKINIDSCKFVGTDNILSINNSSAYVIDVSNCVNSENASIVISHTGSHPVISNIHIHGSSLDISGGSGTHTGDIIVTTAVADTMVLDLNIYNCTMKGFPVSGGTKINSATSGSGSWGLENSGCPRHRIYIHDNTTEPLIATQVQTPVTGFIHLNQTRGLSGITTLGGYFVGYSIWALFSYVNSKIFTLSQAGATPDFSASYFATKANSGTAWAFSGTGSIETTTKTVTGTTFGYQVGGYGGDSTEVSCYFSIYSNGSATIAN